MRSEPFQEEEKRSAYRQDERGNGPPESAGDGRVSLGHVKEENLGSSPADGHSADVNQAPPSVRHKLSAISGDSQRGEMPYFRGEFPPGGGEKA